MLIVVSTCTGAFVFRAGIILYCLITRGTTMQKHEAMFPRMMWMPYLLISEVAPYSLLLLFYFIPGCQAIHVGASSCRIRRRHSSSSAPIEENLGTPVRSPSL